MVHKKVDLHFFLFQSIYNIDDLHFYNYVLTNHEGKVVDSKNENELLSIDGLFFVADKLDI